MSSDQAVSEILSFILILGITALGITVFTAAVLPEMEKSEEISHENQLTESVLSVKTGIDKLWILGDCGMQGGAIFFPGSEILMDGGTNLIKEGTKLSFDYDDGETTASLLFKRQECGTHLFYGRGGDALCKLPCYDLLHIQQLRTFYKCYKPHSKQF